MKNIWIETSYILKNKTGIGCYVQNLIDILSEKDFDIKLLDLDLKLPYRYIWQTLWLNTVVYIKTLIQKPDIIICPNFVMPYFTRKKTKYITVIHDIFFSNKEYMQKYNRIIFDISTRIAAKKANIIVTVSNTIKNELSEKYHINLDRIRVLHNPVACYFEKFEDNKDILDKYNIQKQQYILSVATMNKRKNIPELIKAFEQISDKHPDLKLVLVGGMGNEQRDKLTKHQNIIFTGYIKDEEIPVLYKNALIYIFPSKDEGFGTPQVEAQFSGCPVLCSDIPVFREVSGKGAEYCKPIADDIAEKMEYLINNSERREELICLGYENVKRFDKKNIAEQLMEIIDG